MLDAPFSRYKDEGVNEMSKYRVVRTQRSTLELIVRFGLAALMIVSSRFVENDTIGIFGSLAGIVLILNTSYKIDVTR